jgi:hypothetical protein
MVRNVVLVVVSTVIALSMGEGLVFWLAPQDLSGSHLRQSPAGYLVNRSDGRTRHQLGDRVVYYEFSYPHLRGDAPNPEASRILVLGDSFTFGYLLSRPDTYVEHLQRRLDGEFGGGSFQLVNMGTGGWGLSDVVRAVEEFGDIVDPVVVLVFINTDDIGRSIIKGMYTLADDEGFELEDHSGELPILRAKYIVNQLPGYQWLLEHSQIAILVKRAVYYDVDEARLAERRRGSVPATHDVSVTAPHAQRLGRALVRRLNDWSKQRDIRLLVTTTGFHSFSDIPGEPTRLFMEKAPEIFAAEQVPFFDFSAQLYERYEGVITPLVIPGDHHPNEHAAETIAGFVWPWLRENLVDIRQHANQKTP